jgi:glycosyltransferase involved in cell wall biosynthesis
MFDRVLAVSEQVRRYSIEQDRLDPTKVTTLYNAVDTPNLASQESAGAVRALLGVSSAAPIIVSVGNLREIKGFDVLIRAAAKVCRDYPETMFIIAGGTDPREPECLSQLSELSSSLGVGSNVKFLGAVEDVIPFLQASNVFCLLSHSEGFSNALLEAMACGIPCIATRVGGNSEAIEEGRTGFLVEDNDDGATAERILEVLRDPAQAKRIGSSAVEAVTRRFAPEIVMSQLVETYDNVLAQKRESRRAESR